MDLEEYGGDRLRRRLWGDLVGSTRSEDIEGGSRSLRSNVPLVVALFELAFGRSFGRSVGVGSGGSGWRKERDWVWVLRFLLFGRLKVNVSVAVVCGLSWGGAWCKDSNTIIE